MTRGYILGGAGLALVAVLLWSPNAAAFEHRRGTPSAGIKIQGGTTGGDSDWQSIFGQGVGVAVSYRQTIARDRAWGLSAEQQSFDSKHGDSRSIGTVPGDAGYDKLQLQMLLVDYYFYVRRMYQRTPYGVLSAGFYRPQLIDKFRQEGSGETGEHVGFEHKEGFVLRGGLGFEYFLSRSLAIDSSLSGYFFSAPGLDGSALSAQLAIGIHIYMR